MARRTLIAVSVVAHLALGAGVFLSGVWELERLDPDKPSLGAIGLISIAEPQGGAAAAAPKVELKKQPKQVVKTLVQVEHVEKAPVDKTPADPTAGSGEGSGSGTGSGDGSGSGTGSGGACLIADACKPAVVPPDPPKPEPPKPPALVPPTTLQALFVSGERKVHPTDNTKREMLREGKKKTVGIVKACIAESGSVSSVVLVSSTKFAEYDQKLLGAVRGWRYRPHLVDGRPVAACGLVTFIYSID